jgi:hypothetical protein
MKKVNFKNFLMTLSMALAFMLMGLDQANAQTSSTLTAAGGSSSSFAKSGVYAAPQGPFVNPTAAQTILLAAGIDLKDQMMALQQGSAPYNAILNKYLYYQRIDELLKVGQMSVAEAIVDALRTMAFSGVNTPALQLLRQEAINLLHI